MSDKTPMDVGEASAHLLKRTAAQYAEKRDGLDEMTARIRDTEWIYLRSDGPNFSSYVIVGKQTRRVIGYANESNAQMLSWLRAEHDRLTQLVKAPNDSLRDALHELYCRVHDFVPPQWLDEPALRMALHNANELLGAVDRAARAARKSGGAS